MDADPLAFDAPTMRAQAHLTVDRLIDELTRRDAPPVRHATAAELRARVGGPPPEAAEGFAPVLDRLMTDVLAHAERTFHPGYLAFIPSNGTWPGALADLVASALNVDVGHWYNAAGPAHVEAEVLRWFADWIGYPAAAAGVLVSGGSAANMTALACAREARVGPMRDDLVAYVSDQAHSSMARAARVLGFRPDQLRVLPADRDHRMSPRLLRAAVAADRRAGRTPLFVAAAAGATNTGAVDPLDELAGVCAELDLWLHVDAAYGGFAVLTERGRDALTGLELADSVTMDPHKWLYQPFECGALLVRDGEALRSAFTVTPPYLEEVAGCGGEEIDFCDLGMQLSRSARALKVWLSVRTFGLRAFRDAIDRCLDLAAHAAARVEASEVLELVAPPSLGIVCLRRRLPEGADEEAHARANARLVGELERTGTAFVSSTRLRGRYAIRLCVLNHTTTMADVDRTLDLLETADLGPARPAGPVAAARRSLAEQLRTAALGARRTAAAGEVVVEQWALSRECFLIVAGEAEVRVDGVVVAALGPGDLFGELGALDWGRGYGYARSASVVARSPLDLLAFADGALNDLMRRLPALRAGVLARVHERLPVG